MYYIYNINPQPIYSQLAICTELPGINMQYYLPAIESPATATRRIMQQLLDSVERLLSESAPLSDSSVHEIRKSCKKMRALLRLVQPELSAGDFRGADRQIRKLAAQLGTQRDNKVLADTFSLVTQYSDTPLSEAALAPVRAALLERAMPDATLATDRDALLTLLDAIRATVHDIHFGGISRKTIISGMTASYRRGRRAYAALEAEPDTENAHSLRRQAKYHYYQLQFTAAWNEAVLTPLCEDFHRLEDTLGNDHDLAVLGENLASQPQLCAGKAQQEMLNALIENRRFALLSAALRQAGELYQDKPREYRGWLQAACLQSG